MTEMTQNGQNHSGAEGGGQDGPSREAVLDALRTVSDPATGRDIVTQGLVQGLVIRGRDVGFALEVPAERGPAMEPARAAAEKAVASLNGVGKVTAVLTAHRDAAAAQQAPDSPPTHRHGKAQAPQGAPGGKLDLPGVKAMVAVASGKGGVGKSTVAVNLAAALAGLGLRTGILDADIYGPSVPRMLGIENKTPEQRGDKLMPLDAHGLKAMSIGFLVDTETALIWRGPMVMSALTQMLRDVEWGELDVLVIDMPPGTGDAQLTLAQRAPLTGAVIVSTPQEVALIDARKGIAMFEKTRVPVLGMIENMSYFIAPGTEEKTYIFGHGGAKATAQRLGVAFLGDVPIDISLRETSDDGRPLTATDPDSDTAKRFLSIAAQVAEKLKSAERAPPAIKLI